MTESQRLRAWKDVDYRATLSDDELDELGENPAGPVLLSDFEIEAIVGGSTEHFATLGCCGGITTDPGLCSAICYSAQCCTNCLT